MDDRNVDRIVRSALAAGVLDTGPHPDPDTLFHYHAEELSTADAESVQAHLALCRECAQVVLDFAMFPHLDALSEDEVPTAEEIAKGWADVQERLGQGAAARRAERDDQAETSAVRARGAVVVPLTPRGGVAARPQPPPRRAPVYLQAAAVVLGVASLGLGIQVTRQHRALNAPEGNVGIVGLQPEDDAVVREAGRSGEKKSVSRAAKRITFALALPARAGEGPFTARLRVGATEVVPPPLRASAGRVTFNVVRSDLPAGDLEIQLFAAGRDTPVARYPFELTYE